MSAPNPYRLPTEVIPSSYRLEITPDLETLGFVGHVEIALDVRRPTSQLVLHCVDLQIDRLDLTDTTGALRTSDPVADGTFEWITIGLDRELEPGPATFTASYHGQLNDKLVGFYSSTFVDEAGETRRIATTQFESSDARRALPCFDEPTMKATFEVILNVPAELACYSNSPVASETTRDGKRQVRFAPTMKMSSYLLAFVIGPFEETPAIDVGGTPLRAITPLGKSHLTSFALEAGEHALRFFSEYFDIPYPGDKLDLVAIPDFAFGAMENLGCVTFRESAMLVDPAKASLQELERVATVVAHEIAHMWFGDLVTMQWWEGIWLNEAFATFMEVLCTNNFRPEWKPWLSFATDRDMALEIDGLHATRPIEYEVVSPSEMRGMFDLLTYEKGGSVLRMLEQFLGPDVFRDGIRHYLKKHSYANTVTTDLWDALEEISGQPVRDTMNTWILQGGHPLVELENGILSQRPFAYGEPGPVPSAIGSNWLTPVVTRPLPTGDVEKILLGKDPVTVGTGARVINGGGVGVFRSRYGSVELGMVASHLDQLDEIERAVLFADSWAALFSSRTTWSDFLGLARRLGDKDEPTSWRFIAQAFDFAQRAADDRQRRDLAHPVREIFGPQLARLGYDVREGESPLAGQVRATAIGILGTLGADEVVQERCADLTSRGEFDGDMARAALRVTAGLNRREDFDLFLQRARDAESPQIQQRYQWGLADFTEEPFALEAAEHCFNEFRTQDAPIVLGLLSRQRATGPAVWKLVTSRWNEIRDRFPPNVQSRVTSGVPTFIADHPFAAEVAEFHRSHPIPGEERLLEQLLERLRVGLDFADAMRTQL